VIVDFLFIAAYPFWVILIFREIDVELVFSHWVGEKSNLVILVTGVSLYNNNNNNNNIIMFILYNSRSLV
jgi:hypothetical protein